MAAYDRLRTLERRHDRLVAALRALKREHAAEQAQGEFYLRCVRDQIEVARREWNALCPPRRGPSTIDYRALAGVAPRQHAAPPGPVVRARTTARPRECRHGRRTRRSSSSSSGDDSSGSTGDSDPDPPLGGLLVLRARGPPRSPS